VRSRYLRRKYCKRAIILGLVTGTACGLGVTGPGSGAIRFLVVEGPNGPGQVLVEYQGPPLVTTRSMPTFTSDSGMFVLARDGTGGGFYAMQFAGSFPLVPGYKLVRYDAEWHVAATYVDTTSVATQPYLQRTPDGRYVVAGLDTPSGTRSLLVLDPVTLAVIHRSVQPLYLVDQGDATAATGSQVLLTSPNSGGCSMSLVWWDASTGLAADSTTMAACGYSLVGAITHRQVYRWGPQSGAHTELFDLTAGTVLATADSVGPFLWPYALLTLGRLVIFENGDAAVVDPQALTLFGRVATGTGLLGPRFVNNSMTDPATGDVIGATADPTQCVACAPSPDGIVVIDPSNLQLLADQRLAVPVQLVH
jgi:hypothetical protein